MNKYNQLLIQANENLRATDNKRDQVYYFFIVILGLFLAFYGDVGSADKLIGIGLNIFLIFLGTIMIFVIINYQIWHIIYVNTAIVIQKIINQDIKGPIDDDILNKLVSEIKDSGYKFFGRYGTEFFIYISFLALNLVLIGLLIYQIVDIDITHISWIICIIVIFLIYVCSIHLIRRRMLKKAEKDFLKMAWILKL